MGHPIGLRAREHFWGRGGWDVLEIAGMDADRGAFDGYAGSDDGDEGDGGGTVGLGKLNCYYSGYRYGLPRGRDCGERDCDRELDGIYDGAWTGGTERDGFSDDCEWDYESGVGAECWIDADGDL